MRREQRDEATTSGGRLSTLDRLALEEDAIARSLALREGILVLQCTT